jgi:hypothetical protein
VGTGVGTPPPVIPSSEKEALNTGAGAPPTMSVPMRSQSGSRLASRIQLWRSGVNGVPAFEIGLAAESQ